MDEVRLLRSFRVGVADPPTADVESARASMFAPRPRRAQRRLALAVAAAAGVVAVAGAVAASVGGILDGPRAPRENEAALQDLFPPLQIGRAVELARYEGRELFGARTAKGGYCFSATSPTDPKGAGGHCVTAAESRALDSGGFVAFGMSGWTVGGYAPGATNVRITGGGLDLTLPVQPNGWWVGVARVEVSRGSAVPEGDVVATGTDSDGTVVGSDPLMRISIMRDDNGRVAGIGFALI